MAARGVRRATSPWILPCLLLLAAAACERSGPRVPAVPSPENDERIEQARALERDGRPQDALRRYEEALKVQPDLGDARIRAADLARRTGADDAAARHARRALGMHPSDPGKLAVLARALAPTDAKRAADALAPALADAPDRADVQVAAAEVALAGGDRSGALGHLRAALAADPDATTLLDIGRAFSRAGFHSDAVAAVRKAIETGGRTPEARYALGWVLEQAERYQECVSEYTSLIADHPDYLPPYRNLGALMARDGELARAIDLWERGLKLHPDDAGLRANIDEAMDALGVQRGDSSG